MSIRQAVVFISRIALAYTRIGLVSTLKVTALSSLFFLVISGGMLLIDSATTVDKVVYAARLITVVVSTTAAILSVLAGIGLIWNLTGLMIGFVNKSDDLDLEQLPAEIPRYLARLNKYGLPVISFFLLYIVLQRGLLSAVAWSVLVFLWSLMHHGIAARAWKRVISVYPLYTQNAKKKKSPPSIARLEADHSATDDFNTYIVDDTPRLRKLQ